MAAENSGASTDIGKLAAEVLELYDFHHGKPGTSTVNAEEIRKLDPAIKSKVLRRLRSDGNEFLRAYKQEEGIRYHKAASYFLRNLYANI